MALILNGDGSVGPLSATEVGYLDGVTSSVQTQINGIGVYQAWTPTFANFTIGNGTVTARYTQVGKMVHLWMRVTWGSTTSSGSGVIVSGLPVNAYSNDAMVAANVWMHLVDDSAGTFHWGTSHSSNNNSTRIWISPTNLVTSPTQGSIRVNQDVTATNPFTWANGDRWFMTAVYEGA